MKKLLCIVCLLAAVLFVDTASACSSARCFNRTSYRHGFYSGRHHGYGSYGRHYRFHRIGHGFGLRHTHGFGSRGYASCTRCGGFRRW